jgi:Co/Zn/Cd efflux system component
MSDCCAVEAKNQGERRLLWTVLILNGLMFFVEFTAGWLAQSSGLIADSLDMLADAAVYSVSLYAVGKAVHHRAQAAMLNGSLQLMLGLGVLVDVARRIWFGSQPQALTMSTISVLALAVNVSCFLLLYKFRQGDINLRSSWICSRNDMIANLGVLVAAGLVAWLGAAWPDWAIGALIAGLIVYSAVFIIRDARIALKNGQAVGSSCCDA